MSLYSRLRTNTVRRNGAIALGLLLFAGSALAAWRAADRRWANLWETPAQQGDRLMARREYAAAAKAYPDPLHRGVALYRAGEFAAAAAEFGRLKTPEAAFNRGNALVMTGKYADAIASYERALKDRPDWSEARQNRDLAQVRLARMSPPNDGSEGTEGQIKPDEIVFDNKPRQAGAKQTETVTGGTLSDSDVQALWLRRVQTRPADFLRAKFAYQESRQSATKDQTGEAKP